MEAAESPRWLTLRLTAASRPKLDGPRVEVVDSAGQVVGELGGVTKARTKSTPSSVSTLTVDLHVAQLRAGSR